MKKNVSPLAVVAALVLVGLMIYGVFQALTQTGSTANPEYANKVPEYARQRGMVGSPASDSNSGANANSNTKK
jgi:hypothetical protein